ncbi:MAG: phosphatidylserine decarboxylase, partial [Bradyrhizobium sp.]
MTRRFRTALLEEINFLLTNRIPRQLANHAFAWFSRIESPALARIAIAAWRYFGDLDLADAASARFVSVHDCFTRQLKPGARPVDRDPSVITSPCDAIVGASGSIAHDRLIQAKGLSYTLGDLLADPRLVEWYINGQYVTLRLTAGMYHRFHTPYDCCVERVTYISGDTWDVNPVALARIAMLFCKNERAVIPLTLPQGDVTVTIVAVAA